eukprot:CAMPEP_0182612462 /NCGR_PEP_ID=MMETSP1330-20130603/18368_2 /TAXON_ID=464278 /ORGANISM="Picochlorum sp., Strain RCC944" /LENGTH=86 /DNA_ID=CAMNT_0024832011 /DNA_START=307 /DNA_END=564 /DNA_ORIENTATION=-
MNPRNPRVLLELLSQLHSVLVLSQDSQLQRLHPSQKQVSRVRVHHASEDVLHVLDLVHDLLLACDVPAQDIVMPCHVLGARRDNQV